MMTPTVTSIAVVLLFAGLLGCSKPEAPPQAVAAAPDAVPAEKPTACDMVTQQQMSEILGMEVVGVPDESSSGVTECVYTATKSLSPDASVSVEWGEGQAAMMGAGRANQKEPGLADPFEGIGDEAALVGPVLFVRSGDDLVKIYLTGVDDIAPPATKIFALLQPKL